MVIFAVTACSNKPEQVHKKKEIPQALDDKGSYDVISRGNSDDLVESLYTELASNDPELKKLEGKIAELNNSKTDAITGFYRFNEKNKSFYNAADKYIQAIEDSVLRERLRILVTNHLANYNAKIGKNQELLKLIESRQLKISDLHKFLKVFKTLSVIENYQMEYSPQTKPLEGYIKKQDGTLKLVDTLLK